MPCHRRFGWLSHRCDLSALMMPDFFINFFVLSEDVAANMVWFIKKCWKCSQLQQCLSVERSGIAITCMMMPYLKDM